MAARCPSASSPVQLRLGLPRRGLRLLRRPGGKRQGRADDSGGRGCVRQALASCRLRFPGTGTSANESDLPFGAFPGSTFVKWLSKRQRSEIRKLAAACPEQEVCGFVFEGGEVLQAPNVAADPTEQFEISPLFYAKHEGNGIKDMAHPPTSRWV